MPENHANDDKPVRLVTLEFADGSFEHYDLEADPTGVVLAYGAEREISYEHYWEKSGTLNLTLKKKKP